MAIEQIQQEIQKKKAFIWTFGKNTDGELGIGSLKDSFLPKAIASNIKTARYISSGSHHSAIVSKNGELFVSGS